ncbi:hypothetical protein N8709_04155, partial [Candidatus Pelagibacter sp.]|nr:hypothetical protein [Candidatus Pelagibacter sp.]
VFQENLSRIKDEISKKFPDIDFSQIKIFLEAYRDAFRKETQWGTLDNPITDKIDFFNKKVVIEKDINRDLGEIDSSNVRFRAIMSFNESIIAASEGFRPLPISNKEEILKVQKFKDSQLMGVLEIDMEELFSCNFHTEPPHEGKPVIYVNKKLGIKSDISSDSRIKSLIFSSAFKELIRKSIVDPDNEYKKRLLDYAQTFSETHKWEDLKADKVEVPSDVFENQEINEFIDDATSGYISAFNLLKKYQEQKNEITDDLDAEENEYEN